MLNVLFSSHWNCEKNMFAMIDKNIMEADSADGQLSREELVSLIKGMLYENVSLKRRLKLAGGEPLSTNAPVTLEQIKEALEALEKMEAPARGRRLMQTH